MNDQYWDFAYSIMYPLSEERNDATDGKPYTLEELGCDYVPLGLTIKSGMTQRYHTYGDTLNTSSGIAVTTSCANPDLAFKFLNDLLSQEIHDLRFWGIEGQDYLIDEYGQYYRTEDMRALWSDPTYLMSHTCEYSYFPQWHGLSEDGINCRMPAEQPSEYLATLPDSLVDCFEAYGANNYVEFLGSVECETYPWYPLWSWSNSLTSTTSEGSTFMAMTECKHEWLPKVVIDYDFDASWEDYMRNYNECKPEVFLDAAQKEVESRLAG
jgi:putative aldouronate transport system substrate-binding protein